MDRNKSAAGATLTYESIGTPPPDDMRSEQMCMISYHRALQGCPSYTEYFKDGDAVPTQLCELHSGTLQQRAERAIQGVLGALGRRIRGIFK